MRIIFVSGLPGFRMKERRGERGEGAEMLATHRCTLVICVFPRRELELVRRSPWVCAFFGLVVSLGLGSYRYTGEHGRFVVENEAG